MLVSDRFVFLLAFPSRPPPIRSHALSAIATRTPLDTRSRRFHSLRGGQGKRVFAPRAVVAAHVPMHNTLFMPCALRAQVSSISPLRLHGSPFYVPYRSLQSIWGADCSSPQQWRFPPFASLRGSEMNFASIFGCRRLMNNNFWADERLSFSKFWVSNDDVS